MKRLAWMVFFVFLFTGVASAGPLERFYKEREADTLIELDESDVAVIELESNPSTGHTWEADDLGQNVRIVARVFEPLNPGMLGSPGIERIYVVGRSKGRSDLTFKYQRPFEKRAQRSLRFRFNAKRQFKETLKQVSSLQGLEASPEADATDSADAQVAISASLGLPTSFNYCTAHGGCPPVRDQGQCGACWAFATQGLLECRIKGEDGVSVDLSEQYLISCNDENYSCYGGWWAHEYNLDTKVYGEKEAGAPMESTMPYRAAKTACNPSHAKAYKISNWGYVCGNQYCTPTTAQIKQAIYEHGPVAAAVCVDYAFETYRGGVFKGSWLSCWQVNHGVVLVGWDDSNSCWIMRNQWGSSWGESGYMRIGYGVNQIGYGASWVEYAGGGGNGNGGGSDTTCRSWTATNAQHVSANRAYIQSTSSGCAQAITYYAKGSNENMGTWGGTSTTLRTEDGGQTYHIGNCSSASASSSSSSSGCNY